MMSETVQLVELPELACESMSRPGVDAGEVLPTEHDIARMRAKLEREGDPCLQPRRGGSSRGSNKRPVAGGDGTEGKGKAKAKRRERPSSSGASSAGASASQLPLNPRIIIS